MSKISYPLIISDAGTSKGQSQSQSQGKGQRQKARGGRNINKKNTPKYKSVVSLDFGTVVPGKEGTNNCLFLHAIIAIYNLGIDPVQIFELKGLEDDEPANVQDLNEALQCMNVRLEVFRKVGSTRDIELGEIANEREKKNIIRLLHCNDHFTLIMDEDEYMEKIKNDDHVGFKLMLEYKQALDGVKTARERADDEIAKHIDADRSYHENDNIITELYSKMTFDAYENLTKAREVARDVLYNIIYTPRGSKC